MSMLRPIDHFFLKQEEPVKSCLLVLREMIPAFDKHISEEWKYGLPFYCYKGKMFCYLWLHKKYRQPYIGFVRGDLMKSPELLQEKRKQIKILLIDPEKDIPVKKIRSLLKEAKSHY